MKYVSLLACWNSETCGFVFRSACEAWRASAFSTNIIQGWQLRHGDLGYDMEQNSGFSCQPPLQSVLLIKHCHNTSFKAWFWWIYLTLYMTEIAQSNGMTLAWPSSWRVLKELSLSVHRAAWEQQSREKGVLSMLCQCLPFGNTARAYVLKVKQILIKLPSIKIS